MVVDLDDRQRVGGNDVDISDCEEDGEHVKELHDGIQDDGCYHRARDAEAGFANFVRHVEDAVEAYR